MITDAGERTEQVTFRRAATTRGALGGKNPGAAASLGTRFAKVLWGSGAERRAAAAEQGVQAATFRVLADSVTRGVLATDSILHVRSGLTFDITGIAPIGRTEIEFTGVASRG